MGENSEQQRGPGKPFTKDDPRINRGGRPKGYNAFRRAFRGKDDVVGIRKRLMELIQGDDPGAALAAAKLWLEYGFGKTPAAPDDNDAVRDSGNAWPLSREETLELAKAK